MKVRKVIIFALLAILSTTIACGTLEYEATVASEGPLPELQVHFINLGYGDTILLDLGDTEVLIDGGLRVTRSHRTSGTVCRWFS